ncbi:hypothetical protein BUALT_Bualt09G0033300 [Buddleja alternifolia]|uniref:cytokinin dehydrogenase n=1 Tax=Buddleja alternifolia TaxID=168488 RepID=A0AAV6XAB9_9LAMI|nr:hypothetical protein BUALT_Bualt09G0033300 [Buddleja alternifolia]
MRNPCLIPSHFTVFLIIISYSTCIVAKPRPWTNSLIPNHILSTEFASNLRDDPDAITKASNDYGNLIQDTPSAVLYPSSVHDIINLIKFSNNCSTPFSVSARGRGHSIRGQATARDGVVVEMSGLSKNGIGIRVSWSPSLGYYADVGGEQLWIDVLRATMEHDLAPVSWTDYLYLSVGGTLSNGGISGQSFLHGPQISNVLELDVITGKGEFMTCSKHMNSELFFGVLGGLGQFGVITRARIILHKAPTKEIELLMKDLEFIPGFIFKKDVPIIDFLSRVKTGDNQKEAHPWLNLFVPKSRINDFNAGVFVDIIGNHNQTKGPILFYPFNRKKWDDRMSAVTPDEDIFYTLGLLHSSGPDESEDFDKLNNKITEFCEKAGIEIKQYLPYYKSKEDWMKHFGSKWNIFEERKMKFDPRMILSPGQRIFTSDLQSDI